MIRKFGLVLVLFSVCLVWMPSVTSTTMTVREEEISAALSLLTSLGVPANNLCTTTSTTTTDWSHYLPLCTENTTITENSYDAGWVRSRRQRYLMCEEEESLEDHDTEFYVTHALCAFACVCTAALAAGLTMGMLSLDPLLLLIKKRAGSSKREQEQAAKLLPIVKQHHMLLVTLLLLNSIANEALPLFLEVLVSPAVAVLLSVTLVLFFGEIIPSAIFTGPNKIEIASKLTPLVRLVMVLLWPIAFPISKMLDYFLHHDENDSMFDRGELSALVRIQYEERMAVKHKHKKDREAFRNSFRIDSNNSDEDTFGGGKYSRRSSAMTSAIKATKRELEHQAKPPFEEDSEELLTPKASKSVSIHVDEVAMVEGALSMKTKRAIDVYTPLNKVFSVPYDLVLTEENMISIYSSGHSRIPVFERDPKKPKNVALIRGVLMTKNLIVVNFNDRRPLATLPLLTPLCVSPRINLVDLLNLFQTGTVGHLALVCTRPKIAAVSLKAGKAIPEKAGYMGVITIEDVLETLLQEQIYDENDIIERKAGKRIAKFLSKQWKGKSNLDMGDVVQQAMENYDQEAGEGTSLLGGDDKPKKGRKSFLGLF